MISYLICTSPRTGSNLLCEALTKTRVAGEPTEYFYPRFKARISQRWAIAPALTYQAYLREVLAKTSATSGVFGAKLMQKQLPVLLAELHEAENRATDREVIEKLLPGVRIILLSRENKLRQAISFWRAKQTKSWTAAEVPIGPAVFDFEKLDSLVARFTRETEAWEKWCAAHRFEPLVLTYEELTRSYEASIERVLKFVGSPAARVVPAERGAQHDALNDDWAERFLALKKSHPKVSDAPRWLARWFG